MLDIKPPARSPDGTLELVTTHLELRHPPRHPRVSITGRTLALVHAKRPTLHFYRYLYETVGSPYLWWERREMDDQALSTLIHDDRIEVHVLQVDGVPAGFAELDRRQTGEVGLTHFGLVEVVELPDPGACHLVRIDAREVGELPALDAVRLEVYRDLMFERTNEAEQAYFDGLLEQYTVTVEWPEGMDPVDLPGVAR